MTRARFALAALVTGALAACHNQTAADASGNVSAPVAVPQSTIQQFMEQQINPAAEYAFRSVREVADEKGQRLEQPSDEASWKQLEAKLEILRDAPAVLTAPGLRVAPPGFKAENPSVESEPGAIQTAIDQNRDDFAKRADRLRIAAAEALLAAKARDPKGMIKMLEGLDRACESCHLRYFYPGDQRAQQAARASYILN